MTFEENRKGLVRLFGILIVTTALAGCGGASSNSATNPATSSSASTDSPTVALSATYYTVVPASSAIITLYRTGSSAGTATAGYSTIDGTAVAGTDYVATSGNVTWQAEDTSAKTVLVPVASTASGKSFTISLTSVEGAAALGNPDYAIVNVTNVVAGTPAGSSSGGSTGSGTVSLSWTAPTENANGTALTNLAGYNIYYGTSTSAMTSRISISTVGVQSYMVDNLSSGNWYFALTSVNSAGVESGLSGTVEATL
jgi:hypothetical protein